MARKTLMAKAKKKPKFAVRKYNRCPVCGRARAYMRKFAMCRLCFRKNASVGLLPGVVRASW